MELQPTHGAPRIFVSHGSNHTARDELADFLRELGLYPVISEKEPSQSRDPGQKVRKLIASSVGAVVLATQDEETSEGWKPRQNVIHEIALLEERLLRKFVVLKEEGTVLPSNVNVTYIPFSQGQVTGSYTGLLRELKSILKAPLNFSKSSGDDAYQMVMEQEVWRRALETISLSRRPFPDDHRAAQNISFITTVWAHTNLDEVVLKALGAIALEATMNSDEVGLALAEEVGFLGQTKIMVLEDDGNLIPVQGEKVHATRRDEEFVMECIDTLEEILYNVKEYRKSRKVIDVVKKQLKEIAINAEVYGLEGVVKRVDAIIKGKVR